MMIEQLLLTKVSVCSQKYDLLNKQTGGYFNIFDIANIAYDETTICRVLHELLSPKGSHHQGSLYLSLFVEKVLNISLSDAELEAARVHREYRIDDSRRIDLVIETANRFIPIEVKIYAAEQAKQCYDYFAEAKRRDKVEPVIYYLTLFGTLPSEYSAADLTKQEVADGDAAVKTISFGEDILDWLDHCLKQGATIKIAAIREVIQQFMSAIRKITNKMEDKQEMEIKELLSSSPEQMKSAVQIQKTLKVAQTDLIIRLFQSIEEKLRSNYGLEKLKNKYDYEHEKAKLATTYYDQQKSTCPGISYICKSSVKPEVDVWVRVEIDWRIFIGYACPTNGLREKFALTNDEIKSILNLDPRLDSWWATWEYLPNNTAESCPNFKQFNEAYYELYDKSKFDTFTDLAAKRVNELLELKQ